MSTPLDTPWVNRIKMILCQDFDILTRDESYDHVESPLQYRRKYKRDQIHRFHQCLQITTVTPMPITTSAAPKKPHVTHTSEISQRRVQLTHTAVCTKTSSMPLTSMTSGDQIWTEPALTPPATPTTPPELQSTPTSHTCLLSAPFTEVKADAD